MEARSIELHFKGTSVGYPNSGLFGKNRPDFEARGRKPHETFATCA